MKTGKVFWGVLFVAMGILLLLERLDVLYVGWGWVWRFWPLILVAWGVVLLTGNKQPWKTVVVGLFAIGLAVFVLSVINFGWGWHARNWAPDDREYDQVYEQQLSHPYDTVMHRASFKFESAVGSFKVEDTTTQLIEAAIHSSFGRYEFDTERVGDLEQVTLRLEGGKQGRWRARIGHRADIRLNPIPVWDMRFDIGASAMDVDVSPFVVERLVVSAGAARVRLTLGDRAKETRVSIKSGVSSLQLLVPDSVGCEINAEVAVSRKSFGGFRKLDSGVYRTENFESATKKIYIDLDAGVSSVSVKRYGM